MKAFFRKIRHKMIVKKLAIPQDGFVLDTSCQDGGFLFELLKINQLKDITVNGVDISKEGIEKAKNLIPEGNFTLTDNVAIPYKDKSFDIVISSMTLHHMSHAEKSILEMKRVLKDNGSIYLIDIIATHKVPYFFLKRMRCPEPYHFEKFYFYPEIESILLKNGLCVKEMTRVFIFPTLTIFRPILILKVEFA